MKTWKREVAGAGLLYVAAMGVYAAVAGSEMAYRVMETCIAPVMLFSSGAWGFDAWVKQGGGSQGGQK